MYLKTKTKAGFLTIKTVHVIENNSLKESLHNIQNIV